MSYNPRNFNFSSSKRWLWCKKTNVLKKRVEGLQSIYIVICYSLFFYYKNKSKAIKMNKKCFKNPKHVL